MAGQPPLDEVVWHDPGAVQWLGNINTNTVLRYFAESPFFDHTSNNATLNTQAMYNPSMVPMIFNRQAYEARLRTMQGLEYMIAYESQQLAGALAGEESRIWVIRKQNRRKRQGMDDELTVLATYYVAGETIYQSPSVYNIISSRMLTSVSALTKLLLRTSSLPLFTPALGHTYFAPIPNPPASAPSVAAYQHGRDQHGRDSKEPTPMPSSRGDTPSIKLPPTAPSTAQNSSICDARTIFESFNLAMRYGNEYMDENPLLGEPGSFVFSSTNERLKAQQQRAAQQAGSKLQNELKSSGPSTPQPTVQGKPDGKAGGEHKRSKSGDKTPIAAAGGTAPKPKRRKSKAVVTPVNPTGN